MSEAPTDPGQPAGAPHPGEAALEPHPDCERPPLPSGDLWVFAYGSLLWRPGFAWRQCLEARLHGYHRALCVWSHVHRGTPERPGMVLGLDRGGSCRGRLYQVAACDRDAVAAYLYARELATPVYRARLLQVRPLDQETVTALTFVVDPSHHQYAGRIQPRQAAARVATAEGISGSSRDYLQQTLVHLQELGIRDRHLEAIAETLKP